MNQKQIEMVFSLIDIFEFDCLFYFISFLSFLFIRLTLLNHATRFSVETVACDNAERIMQAKAC